jgi:hypothetical protein
MSADEFTCCSMCGRKLHTTFFCQECGQASCSLDCYCRHESTHAGAQKTAEGRLEEQDQAARPQPAR